MEKKTKNTLRYLFWAAVAVVLVYFCFRSIDWTQFMLALEHCKWEWVLVSIGLGILSLFIRGLRWRMLLAPLDPKTSIITCFNAYNICSAVNLFLPRVGEVVRLAYVVKNSSKDEEGKRLLSADKALGSIVTERVWDMLFVGLITALVLVLKWEDFGAFFTDNFSWGGKMLALIIPGILLTVALAVTLFWFMRDKGGVWGRIWNFIRGIGEGLGSFRRMKQGWLFLLYTFLVWTLYWLMTAAVVQALKDMPMFSSLTLGDALFISLVGSLSSMVPIPGGFGIYHGMVSGALQVLWGIPKDPSMAFAVLNHESQVLTQAVCGLVSYIHESFFRKK
jgi:hypothetical protein